jgi:hypothetical protein
MRLTWVIVAGVVAVSVAGIVDALRSSEPPVSTPNTRPAMELPAAGQFTSPAGTVDAPLARCTAQQIAVAIDVLGGAATIVVRHVWGKPCHLSRLPIDLTVKDRAGSRVRLPTTEGSETQSRVGGDFSPGFEQLINITYLPNCDQRGPFDAFVNVGPYSARRKLSGNEVGCFRGG